LIKLSLSDPARGVEIVALPDDDFPCHSDGGLHNPALGKVSILDYSTWKKNLSPNSLQHGRFAFFNEVEMLYDQGTD